MASAALSAHAVGCLYMPHFAAWAAGAARGERDAVIVHCRDKVVAASPAYLARGLAAGASLHRARMLFPRARFLPRDLPAEQVYADHLRERLYQLTPQVTLLETPRLTGCWALLQGFAPDGLEQALQDLCAQGGWAELQPHAMLAALYAAAGQLSILASPAAFYRTAPLLRLLELGFASRTIELLQWVGMRTLADLQRLTRNQLQAQFGTEGRRLCAWLHPAVQPVRVPHYTPRSVTVAQTLPWNPDTAVQLHPYLHRLIRAVCQRLGGMAPTWIRLAVIQRGGHTAAHFQALKPPFAGARTLQGPAQHLLDKALLTLRDEHPVNRLVLTAGGLAREEPVQTSLFAARPHWHTIRPLLLRRFPQRFFRPIHHTDAPFFPEEEYALGALAD